MSSETVFRFVVFRPPEPIGDAVPSIHLAQDSPLQQDFRINKTISRSAVLSLLENYASGTSFIGSPTKNPLHGDLKELSKAFDKLVKSSAEDISAELSTLANTFANAHPGSDTGSLRGTIIPLKDSIFTIKFTPSQHACDLVGLAAQLKDLDLVLTLTNNDSEVPRPKTPAELKIWRQRGILLPTDAELDSILSSREALDQFMRSVEAGRNAKKAMMEGLRDKYRQILSAVDDLTTLPTKHFSSHVQEEIAGTIHPGQVSRLDWATRKADYMHRLTALNIKKLEIGLDGPRPIQGAASPQTEHNTATTAPRDAGELSRREPEGIEQLRDLVGDVLRIQDVVEASEASQFADKILNIDNFPALASIGNINAQTSSVYSLAENGLQALKKETIDVVKSRNFQLLEQPFDLVVDSLEDEMRQVVKDLPVAPEPAYSFVQSGNAIVRVQNDPSLTLTEMVTGVSDAAFDEFDFPSIPNTHALLAPAGIADLIVVKQNLVKYESLDVAHIENVLRGENRQHELVQKKTMEQTTSTETETTTVDERSVENATRYELSTESKATIVQDFGYKAAAALSGKYGPTVDFSVSGEVSGSNHQENVANTASKYGKDITERAAKSITERVLQKTTTTVTTETTSTDKFQLDNRGKKTNVSGVYQWVNKIYECQMWNYGTRTMYDLMLPEPAANISFRMEARHRTMITIDAPPKWDLRPSYVTEDTFPIYANKYKAKGIKQPPKRYITKSTELKGGDTGKQEIYTSHVITQKVQIPEGYVASYALVSVLFTVWETTSGIMAVQVGSKQVALSSVNGSMQNIGVTLDSHPAQGASVDGEVSEMSISVLAFDVKEFTLSVEVKCVRTKAAMSAWAFETFTALHDAWQVMQEDYESKRAAAEIRAGVVIQGDNPASNQRLIRDELKRLSIELLTEQHFESFDSYDRSSSTLGPIVRFPKARNEGTYVRFFEQAFEWEQLTYTLYPYYWSNKSTWSERLAISDPDPLFADFLKAGFARVQLPVRQKWEAAVDHFLTTGDIWLGKGLPIIGNDLYLPIAQEIAEKLGKEGDDVTPIPGTWQIVIPTTEVKLRPDDLLPEWEKVIDAATKKEIWVEKVRTVATPPAGP